MRHASQWMRFGLLCLAAACVCGPALAGVVDDPLLQRFTGLRIIERYGSSGGSQPFFFQRVDVSATVTVTDYYVSTRTERTRKKTLIAFRLSDAGGCEAVSFGEQDEDRAMNPWAMLGEAFGRAALSAAGGGQWSGSERNWIPFDPVDYADWIKNKWIPWRRSQLSEGSDPLARAIELSDSERGSEARSFFKSAVEHFGYITRRNWDRTEDPSRTVCYVPELFARLGDIERADGNWPAAEELYRIACSNPPPFLDDARGVALAHRGYGLCLARRAQAVGADTVTLGRDAAMHLRAYLGYWGDRNAPDKNDIMNVIATVDPDAIERRREEAEAEARYQKERDDQRRFREAVRETMEY